MTTEERYLFIECSNDGTELIILATAPDAILGKFGREIKACFRAFLLYRQSELRHLFIADAFAHLEAEFGPFADAETPDASVFLGNVSSVKRYDGRYCAADDAASRSSATG